MDSGEKDEQQIPPPQHWSTSTATTGGVGDHNMQQQHQLHQDQNQDDDDDDDDDVNANARLLLLPPNPKAAAKAAAAAAESSSSSPNFMGKHRLAAAVAHLQQQIQIIQDELVELDTLGQSSLVCKEFLSTVEAVPDALLPVSKGPAVVGWDRWFQGAHGSRNRKRWI